MIVVRFQEKVARAPPLQVKEQNTRKFDPRFK
jgi:hypothetical protein